MTLLEAMRAIPARPGDPESPTLLVWPNDIPEGGTDELAAAGYDDSPYMIIEGIPRIRTREYHQGHGEMSGLIDLVILQRAAGIDAEDPDHSNPDARGSRIATLAAAVIDALPSVTHIGEVALVQPLVLETETDPKPQRLGTRSGWFATLRVSYRIQR